MANTSTKCTFPNQTQIKWMRCRSSEKRLCMKINRNFSLSQYPIVRDLGKNTWRRVPTDHQANQSSKKRNPECQKRMRKPTTIWHSSESKEWKQPNNMEVFQEVANKTQIRPQRGRLSVIRLLTRSSKTKTSVSTSVWKLLDWELNKLNRRQWWKSRGSGIMGVSLQMQLIRALLSMTFTSIQSRPNLAF